ncbi:MAG: archease [Candidatus Omnitrophica bacterium]|nr:archease [Candidatus Omnitrophota bacterium]
MKRFDMVDAPAGVGLTGYGRTLEELFTHMALGVLSVRADLATVQPMASIPILAQADSLDELLVAWLRELLFAAARDGLVFMNCRVTQIAPAAPQCLMSGEAVGEALTPGRQALLREIKAVTAQEAGVRREGELWTAQVTIT